MILPHTVTVTFGINITLTFSASYYIIYELTKIEIDTVKKKENTLSISYASNCQPLHCDVFNLSFKDIRSCFYSLSWLDIM